jgi:hypothetical protein
MANRYVNAAASLTTTSSTTIYTVPGGCSALVQSIVIANEDSVTRTATAEFYDSSATSTFTLIKDAGVPTASSLNMIDRPFVLEAGDQIRVTAGTANVMDVLASIMLVDESTSVPAGLVTTAALADEAVTSAKLDTALSVTVVCTSGTRPASPAEGQTIYETDTDRQLVWNGSAWVAPSVTYRPPMCRVKQTSGASISDATNTILAFNAEDFDTDGMHDNATNNSRITINTAGVYLVIASVRYTAGISDDTRISILKNGGNVGIDERGPNNSRSGQQVMGYYDLAVSDYLEAQVYQNNSANSPRTIDTPYTFLSAAWIGQP